MKVYVSSTHEDLKQSRVEVIEWLRMIGYQVLCMEDYVSDMRAPVEKCLSDVRSCDLFILLVGWRYGFIPPRGNSQSLSITSMEYQQAKASKKNILVFLFKNSAHTKTNTTDYERVSEFRAALELEHTVAYVDSVDLIKKVSASFVNIINIDKVKPGGTVAGWPIPFDLEENRQWLENVYQAEITSMLSSTDVFAKSSHINEIKNVTEDHSFRKLIDMGSSHLLCDYEKNIKENFRFGKNIQEAIRYLDRRKLHFVVSPAHAGTLAIFYYLRDILNANISFEYEYAHSVEIVKNALNSSFDYKVDGFSLTIATTGLLLQEKSGSFRSSFIMPKMTHGILSNSSNMNRDANGEYLLMMDMPSSELFIFNDLRKKSKLSSNSKASEAKPEEVTAALSSNDSSVRTIIGFPHYSFNYKFNHSILLNNPNQYVKSVFLFLEESVLSDKILVSHLSSLIRHAWSDMNENLNTRNEVVRLMVSDKDYLKTLTRITGILRGRDHNSIFSELYNIEGTEF